MAVARFCGLDWLRGIAALGVMVFHYQIAGDAHWFPRGFLAVDFFFVLSGVVMAAAYDRRFADGLTLFSFLFRTRLPRLYPMLFLGTCAGFIAAILAGRLGAGYGLSFLKQLLLVPAARGGQKLYPYNIAEWSILFELLANSAHALFLWRLERRTLLALITVAVLPLVWCACHFGTLDLGARTTTAPGALVRVAFSYTAGVLLWRLYKDGWVPKIRYGLEIGSLVLLAIMAYPIGHTTVLELAFDVASIVFGFPVIVALGLGSVTQNRLKPVYEWAGEVSYPLYLLHDPVFTTLRVGLPELSGNALTCVAAVVAVTVSWMALIGFDQPARKSLRRWLSPRKSDDTRRTRLI